VAGVASLDKRHKLVNASEHKITVGDGVEVYGMWFEKGYGCAPHTTHPRRADLHTVSAVSTVSTLAPRLPCETCVLTRHRV